MAVDGTRRRSRPVTDARHWHADETLRDGSPITFRAVRPDDKERLAKAFAGLERESVYKRFFRYRDALDDAELAVVDRLDFVHDVMLVVTRGTGPDETVIASGRYIEHDGPPGERVAEVAFTVEEDYAGNGIAKRLLAHLARLARAQGIVRFDADVLADNGAMLAVFGRSGFPIERRRDGGVVHVTLYLDRG
jgi:GNAT superfamily N-acetyltransferase